MLHVITVGELPGLDLDRDLFTVERVGTGSEALDRLGSADVLVVTAYLPQAVELLLARAKNAHPAVVRVGQIEADEGAPVDHLRLAHLVIGPEPTTAEAEQVLVRAAALRGKLDPDALVSFLERFDALPGVPSTWAELTALLADDEVSIGAVAEVIGRDVVLTAEVLRQANSARFAGSVQVAKIEDAIVRLGFATIRSLVLNAEASRLFRNARHAGLSVEGLCDEGLELGRRAAALVEAGASRDEAFLAGMLLEIGQLVLGALLATDYRSVRDLATRRGWPLEDAEAVVLGVTHMHVGARLLADWNLPDAVVRAAQDHHSRTPTRPFGAADAAIAARQVVTLEPDESGPAREAGDGRPPRRRRRKLRADRQD